MSPGPGAKLHHLDPLPLRVSRPLVLLRLGYRSAAQVPEKTARRLDEVLSMAEPLLRPRAVWGTFAVERPEPGRIVIGGALRSASRSLDERLEGCSVAALFAATIGSALEDKVHGLQESGELSRALLADAYGSSAAIALGMAVEEVVSREFRAAGLLAGKRYAPGYGDFELASQEALLRLVSADRVGIVLTEDSLMIPAKSISGVIGGRPVS
jgi:hypothetical protein